VGCHYDDPASCLLIYQLTCRQFIARPLRDVFAFFERPENLERITPPSLKFNVLTPSPVSMHEGSEIKYRVSPLLFPMTWISRIEAYDPPHSFVDTQIKGPYALWRHTHRFIEENGGTWIEDDVVYALPFGLIGRLAHWFVRRQLQGIFDYRSRAILEALTAQYGPTSL
jgi:ligand-binding SRPBCC domain-containing protein